MNLRSELPFWIVRNGLTTVFPAVESDITCDALIVGAGISGALLADELVRRGHDTVVVDRRHAAHGSTSASTGLLQYEVDVPLCQLIGKVGLAHAERAYWMGVEAILRLKRLAGGQCGFSEHPSLLIAKNVGQVRATRREYGARVDAGLGVEWVDGPELKKYYGIARPAAIRSAVAAAVDPYRLTHKLLRRAQAGGARIFDRTDISRFVHTRRSVVAHTGRKSKINARRVFFATGYESREVLKEKIVKISSTYALVSEPMANLDWWRDRTLLWESGNAYLYARTTDDGRIILGGADDEVQNGERRDSLVPRKCALILEQFRRMMPSAPNVDVAFAWAGAFGHTRDGLAYIGESPSFERGYFALGYGGNGITFSVMAARILADLFEGKKNRDAPIFAFDRQSRRV